MININIFNSSSEDLAQRLGGGLPSAVKKVLKSGHAWVAGGYILSKITGDPVKDIDIFFSSFDEYLKGVLELKADYKGIADILDKDGVTTFKFQDGRPAIQAISNWPEYSPDALLNKFDFTIVQCALWNPGTYTLVTHSNFYEDVATRTLRYNVQDESRGSSILRVAKYAGKGYKINTEEMSKLLEVLYKQIYSKPSNTEWVQSSQPVLNFLQKFKSPSGE